MRTSGRLATTAAAVLLSLPALSACSGGDGAGGEDEGPTAEEVLADAATTLSETSGVALTLSTDALLNWPSNLAFGKGHGFGRDLFLVNFGLPLGSGTTILRLPYGKGR